VVDAPDPRVQLDDDDSRGSFVYLKLTPASGATALGSVIDANQTVIKLTHYRKISRLDVTTSWG
jgi:hypothetical protein